MPRAWFRVDRRLLAFGSRVVDAKDRSVELSALDDSSALLVEKVGAGGDFWSGHDKPPVSIESVAVVRSRCCAQFASIRSDWVLTR